MAGLFHRKSNQTASEERTVERKRPAKVRNKTSQQQREEGKRLAKLRRTARRYAPRMVELQRQFSERAWAQLVANDPECDRLNGGD
jgi:hypothetical protein